MEAEKAYIIIHVLECIRDTVALNCMSNSGMYDSREKEQRGGSISIKAAPFTDYIMENFINKKLLEGEASLDFEAFKLNFSQVEMPGESHDTNLKS
jgi:hypothetical protein